MLSNMASSLIKHKRINTTIAKAKALRKYVEPLITKAKEDTTHSRRVVFSYLQNKETVTELFGDIASRVGGRPGGYTRILKTGNRLGDNAEMCFIELVDYNTTFVKEEKKPKAKNTRRGGSGKKKDEVEDSSATEAKKEAAPKKEVKAEAKKEETPKKEAKKEEAPKKEAAPKAEKKEEKPEAKKSEDTKSED